MEKGVTKKVFSERINEPTPNGGVYSIVFFKDKDHNPCTKEEAVHYEITEYDNKDFPIYRTYT